jgi:hypothetical protein
MGVKHVMRVFSEHFFPKNMVQKVVETPEGTAVQLNVNRDIVCDEVVIENALRASGF